MRQFFARNLYRLIFSGQGHSTTTLDNFNRFWIFPVRVLLILLFSTQESNSFCYFIWAISRLERVVENVPNSKDDFLFLFLRLSSWVHSHHSDVCWWHAHGHHILPASSFNLLERFRNSLRLIFAFSFLLCVFNLINKFNLLQRTHVVFS